MLRQILSTITGLRGNNGFGWASTAEEVTRGIDATNLTAIVTGGSGGIGLETARVLALRNARVIIAARNMDSANEAKQLILESNKTARVHVLKLESASFTSIKAFADNFIALDLPLNILILIFTHLINLHKQCRNHVLSYQLSQDGIEIQFATNYLGHFYLTNLLLEKMKETAKGTGVEGRIVNLSSIAHIHIYTGGIRFHNLNDKRRYDDKRAYGQSKLANILHAKELSRRFNAEGVNITANAVHPGLIMTNLFQFSGLWIKKIFKFFTSNLWKNGAATTCYVALHPSLKGVSGKYFVDCNELKPSKFGRDEDLAKSLWDFSTNLVSASEKS